MSYGRLKLGGSGEGTPALGGYSGGAFGKKKCFFHFWGFRSKLPVYTNFHQNLRGSGVIFFLGDLSWNDFCVLCVPIGTCTSVGSSVPIEPCASGMPKTPGPYSSSFTCRNPLMLADTCSFPFPLIEVVSMRH